MSSTNKTSIRLAGYFLIIAFLYVLAVFSDFFIYSYVNYLNKLGLSAIANASKLEGERAELEDRNQIEEAQHLGFNSLIFPGLFEGVWSDLPRKYGIAPLAPQPNTSIYYCNEGYGQVRYRSDRYGFRNSDQLWDIDVLDLMIIGDSFVHGACVDEKSTISAHLQEAGISVLNLGTGSNSPIHYAAIIKTFSEVKKIKNIAVVFYPNDNISGEENSPYNEIFIKNNTSYFEKRVSEQDPLQISSKLVEFYGEAEGRVFDEIKEKNIAKAQDFSVTAPSNKEDSPPFYSGYSAHSGLQLLNIRKVISGYFYKINLPYGSRISLDLLKQKCISRGCTPIVVYIPNSEFWRPDASAKHYKTALKKYTENLGLKFIDATESIDEIGLGAYAKKGPHLSPDGYKLISSLIQKHIEKTKTMPKN